MTINARPGGRAWLGDTDVRGAETGAGSPTAACRVLVTWSDKAVIMKAGISRVNAASGADGER